MAEDTKDYISENSATDASGPKYFQILVPTFATSQGVAPSPEPVPMTSFLRLGGTIDDPSSSKGDELLAVATGSNVLAAGAGVVDAFLKNAATIKANAILSDTGYDKIASDVVAALKTALSTTDAPAAAPISAAAKAAAEDSSLTNDADRKAAAVGAAMAAALGPFADDTRDQGTAYHANGLSLAQRAVESRLLVSKGGWRDHTDGNRVTTTYGDKVEVIRGNYKMVVLGRQDDPGNGFTLDSSGGMLQDNDAAPGQLTEIKWVEGQGGTWRAIETCTKGDVETTFDGRVVERFIGGSVTSIVGREDKATNTETLSSGDKAKFSRQLQEEKDNGFVDRNLTLDQYLLQRGYQDSVNGYFLAKTGATGNPLVYEQTWASQIESYTGSKTTKVPTIIEKTYAENITSETYATTITEKVGSSESKVTTISETTYAGTITGETHADTITETTNATTVNETTTATTINEKTKAHTITSYTGESGSNVSQINEYLYVDNSSTEVHCTGDLTETTFANRINENTYCGGKEEVFIGAGRIQFDLGVCLEIYVGGKVEVLLGAAASVSTVNVAIGLVGGDKYTVKDIG